MATTVQTLLETPPGFRSEAVGRFLWQMDEQRRRLIKDTRGLTVEDLGWQAAPGMNTIGMLLAHVAYTENHLVQIGLEGKATSDVKGAIGLGEEEDAMPLAPGAPPCPALHGRDLAWFDARLERSRAYTHRVAVTLTDADLERHIVRKRPDGSDRVFNVGWVLYHMLEHEAGHHAQINLLRHLRGIGSAPAR
jgi:hypothetical protein